MFRVIVYESHSIYVKFFIHDHGGTNFVSFLNNDVGVFTDFLVPIFHDG